MLSKRIIPCLDIKDGRTVKGISFKNLADAGDPVDLAGFYSEEGADELVLLDITATLEKRETFIQLVKDVARKVSIPFTVGGGINDIIHVENLLNAGADKISINTAAILNPQLITNLSNRFGSQCIVVAVDTKRNNHSWEVMSHAGTRTTGMNTLEWVKKAEMLGAGEILLTSYDADGTQSGFSLDITKEVSSKVSIPVIASGGAGKPEHFLDVFEKGKADAALAAGIFHYGLISIKAVKEFLQTNHITIRL